MGSFFMTSKNDVMGTSNFEYYGNKDKGGMLCHY